MELVIYDDTQPRWKPGNEIAANKGVRFESINKKLKDFLLMMSNQRIEGIIAVQEERARIGGVEVSKKTLVAATDEGVVAVQVNTVEPARGYTYRPALSAPQYRPNPAIDYRDERNCTDYCCLACDGDYKWYKLGGKGCFWYLVLLLLYFIIGVIILPFFILYLVCLCICYPLGCCRDRDDSNAPLFD